MSLIPDHLKALMLSNGRRRARAEHFDPFPIIKLFATWAVMNWLLSDLDPSDADIAFGIIDLGNVFPDLGTVRISDIEAMRGPLGLSIERETGCGIHARKKSASFFSGIVFRGQRYRSRSLVASSSGFPARRRPQGGRKERVGKLSAVQGARDDNGVGEHYESR